MARIFSPDAGRELGLQGMVASLLDETDSRPRALSPQATLLRLSTHDVQAVAQLITWFEGRSGDDPEVSTLRGQLAQRTAAARTRVLGITGTGGAGKSSVVDELLLRLRRDEPGLAVGLLLVDPTRRQARGGALLGDRIRLNALASQQMYARSLATRRAHLALSESVADAVAVLKAAGYGLVIVETAGIGQSDSEIVDLADLSVYVMTPDYGAPSQLEKIDMLELADFVVLNKSDRRGAQDALRDVRKQWRRNHAAFDAETCVPVFATVASRFNDPGVERLYAALRDRLNETAVAPAAALSGEDVVSAVPLIPDARAQYLAEVASAVRGYRARIDAQAQLAGEAGALARVLHSLGEPVAALSKAQPIAAGSGALSPTPRRARSAMRRSRSRQRQVRWLSSCVRATPPHSPGSTPRWPRSSRLGPLAAMPTRAPAKPTRCADRPSKRKITCKRWPARRCRAWRFQPPKTGPSS